MTNNQILSLLKEMKENCEKSNPYDDPKKNDKAEALNFAIFLIGRQEEFSTTLNDLENAYSDLITYYGAGCYNGDNAIDYATLMVSINSVGEIIRQKRLSRQDNT